MGFFPLDLTNIGPPFGLSAKVKLPPVISEVKPSVRQSRNVSPFQAPLGSILQSSQAHMENI